MRPITWAGWSIICRDGSGGDAAGRIFLRGARPSPAASIKTRTRTSALPGGETFRTIAAASRRCLGPRARRRSPSQPKPWRRNCPGRRATPSGPHFRSRNPTVAPHKGETTPLVRLHQLREFLVMHRRCEIRDACSIPGSITFTHFPGVPIQIVDGSSGHLRSANYP